MPGLHHGQASGIAHVGFRLVDPSDIDLAVQAVERAGGIILRRAISAHVSCMSSSSTRMASRSRFGASCQRPSICQNRTHDVDQDSLSSLARRTAFTPKRAWIAASAVCTRCWRTISSGVGAAGISHRLS
jgi:hypothetical protein